MRSWFPFIAITSWVPELEGANSTSLNPPPTLKPQDTNMEKEEVDESEIARKLEQISLIDGGRDYDFDFANLPECWKLLSPSPTFLLFFLQPCDRSAFRRRPSLCGDLGWNAKWVAKSQRSRRRIWLFPTLPKLNPGTFLLSARLQCITQSQLSEKFPGGRRLRDAI